MIASRNGSGAGTGPGGVPTPYGSDDPVPAESTDQLRARIPGWGADLDPRDRPSVPRERRDLDVTSPHWRIPERQPERRTRERSVEHGMLPPVFGTAQPLRGLSGSIRRVSYDHYSEGRAAHWLLLMAADRVDVVENIARAVVSGRPENPLVETGLETEGRYHGVRTRRASTRADTAHQILDQLVVAGPWLIAGWLGWRAGRTLGTSRRQSG